MADEATVPRSRSGQVLIDLDCLVGVLTTFVTPGQINVGEFQIHRRGTPKKEGGEGIVWTCSCRPKPSPPATWKDYSPCEHLKLLYTGYVTEDETAWKRVVDLYTQATSLEVLANQNRVTIALEIEAARVFGLVELTDLGRELLYARWAVQRLGGTQRSKQRRGRRG